MVSLYDLTIPVLTNILQTEIEILKDAEKWAKENGKSVDDLLKARLSPDMYNAAIQVGITIMFTKKILQILVGGEFEQKISEVSLEENYALLQGALSDLAAVKPEALNGREAEIVEFPVGKQSTKASTVDCIRATIRCVSDVLPHEYFVRHPEEGGRATWQATLPNAFYQRVDIGLISHTCRIFGTLESDLCMKQVLGKRKKKKKEVVVIGRENGSGSSSIRISSPMNG
ncbi:hypothetical protein F4805DRAFT_251392 [Annulohypoxylon moriforme]|nr:hypothetical protein F4805DRAFT_251392 [Annulohypoxylon moriforme]